MKRQAEKKINSLSIENVTNGEASKNQHKKIKNVLEYEVTIHQLDWLAESIYFIDYPLKGDFIYTF